MIKFYGDEFRNGIFCIVFVFLNRKCIIIWYIIRLLLVINRNKLIAINSVHAGVYGYMYASIMQSLEFVS